MLGPYHHHNQLRLAATYPATLAARPQPVADPATLVFPAPPMQTKLILEGTFDVPAGLNTGDQPWRYHSHSRHYRLTTSLVARCQKENSR
jgi:hypothetical protein